MAQEQDVYRRLAQHLDDLPGGYPPAESGVELRILRRLFTPDEAELAMHLTLISEEPRVIARRARLPVEETARRLEEMEKKGLIFSESVGGHMRYMATQYVIGIWEFQVNRLTPELVQDMREYFPTLFDAHVWKKSPQLRTIPVGQSIDSSSKVLPYEQAEQLVRAQDRIVVTPCICRQERKLDGEGCDKPEETCLSFGMAADYYQRNGLGRPINQQEALDILKRAEKAGLVLQPANAKKALSICCCCGCCCGVLRSVKRHPQPATIVSTPFVAAANAETCKGCGVCLKRCQMQALSLADDKIVLDLDRCIGCGLCVTTCPTGSLTLVRKPDSELHPVPADVKGTLVKLGQERNRLKITDLLVTVVKSKVDRLLAKR